MEKSMNAGVKSSDTAAFINSSVSSHVAPGLPQSRQEWFVKAEPASPVRDTTDVETIPVEQIKCEPSLEMFLNRDDTSTSPARHSTQVEACSISLPERRNFWSDEETDVMLDIFIDKQIAGLFDGKRYKNSQIYKIVHREMVKQRVFTKNPVQIQNKWKALKSNYTKIIKQNKTRKEARAECDFYDKLDLILGGTRPSSIIEGNLSMDSLPVDREMSNSVEEVIVTEEINGHISPESSSSIHDFGDQEEAAGNPHAEITSAPGPSRKRKLQRTTVGASLRKRDEEFYRHSERMMKMFIDYQREQDEIETKRRKDNLDEMMACFSSNIDKLISSQSSPVLGMHPPNMPAMYYHPSYQAPSHPNQSTPHQPSSRAPTHPNKATSNNSVAGRSSEENLEN